MGQPASVGSTSRVWKLNAASTPVEANARAAAPEAARNDLIRIVLCLLVTKKKERQRPEKTSRLGLAVLRPTTKDGEKRAHVSLESRCRRFEECFPIRYAPIPWRFAAFLSVVVG